MEPVEQKRLPAASPVAAADFGVWVERYQRLVRWRLARWVPRQDVDDLALDVFRAWQRSLETGEGATATFGRGSRGRKRLQAWLLAQARERARQHVRALQGSDSGRIDYRRWRSRRRRPLPPVDALSTSLLKRASRHYRQRGVAAGALAAGAAGAVAAAAGAGAVDAAWQAAALRCLASVPLRYREILEAYYLRARSAQNIADQLQRTPASVRQILLRVRRLLSRAVAHLPPSETARDGDLVLAALPKVRWGELSDAKFVAACLAASSAVGAADVVAEKTSIGPPPWQSRPAGGMVELTGAPPVAVEPPPRVLSPGLAGEGRGRRAKLPGPWGLVGLTAGVGLVVVLGVLLSFYVGRTASPGMVAASDAEQNGAGANRAGANGAPRAEDPRVAGPGVPDRPANERAVAVGAGGVAAMDGGPEAGVRPPLGDPLTAGLGEPADDPLDRALAADPTNLIKDLGPPEAGPQVAELGWGRLITSPDAQWQVDPTAGLGRAPATWERVGVALSLVRGQASLELAAGGSIRFQGPVQLRVRRSLRGPTAGQTAPVVVEIQEGMVQVQVPDGATDPTYLVLADGVEAVVAASSEVWLQASPDFGTTVEVLVGAMRLEAGASDWGTVELQSDGDYLAQVLPASQGDRATPGAVGVVQRAGGFSGVLVHDGRPLRVSQPATFAAAFQVVLRRLREAPARFDADWRVVLEQLESQQRVARRATADDGQGPLYSGDRLPESPDLQQLLTRGLAGPTGLAERFGGQNFAGQLNFNGRVIDLAAIGEIDNVRQELQAELNQARGARANGGGNRRPRGNPFDPDEMVNQMMDHQLRQLEVMANLVNQFPGDAAVLGLADALPGAAGRHATQLDPVVHHFNQLTAATGQEDRDAARQHSRAALDAGLESEQQRVERLEAMRRKLHQR